MSFSNNKENTFKEEQVLGYKNNYKTVKKEPNFLFTKIPVYKHVKIK